MEVATPEIESLSIPYSIIDSESLKSKRPIDLFPYKIKNVNLFYDRNHPENVHPASPFYKKYWREHLKKCIEGIWVDDEGTWVYMMPKLFSHINYGKITDKRRRLILPQLCDNEWIIFTYILCVDGFSGFEGDDRYTCNFLIKRLEDGEELDEVEMGEISDHCKKTNGQYKKFIDPWDYLTRTYLVDDVSGKPLGLPLYENSLKDGMLLSARSTRKSVCIFNGDFKHEFLFGNTKRVEEIKEGSLNSRRLFAMGSGDARQMNRSINNLRASYFDQPGKFQFKDKKKKNVQGGFFKRVQGMWGVGGELKHLVPAKGVGIPEMQGSSLQMVAFKPDTVTVGAGDRIAAIYYEEFGFMGDLAEEVYNANRDSLRSEGERVGRAFYLGCVCAGSKVWNNKGELVSIENLTQEEGILGYDSKEDKIVAQEINHINPPQNKFCYRITTNTGRFIECSEDHPIYVRKRYSSVDRHMKKIPEWSRTDELEINDAIGVVDHVDFWGDKTIFDPRLIGWLVGDGSYGDKQSVMLTSSDEEIWEYVESKYETVTFHKELGKNNKILRKARLNGIIPEIENLGIRGQVSVYKTIPKILHLCDKKTVCDFIGGYFDADGCVSIYKKQNYPIIKASSISKELLENIQLLLNKLGIHGRIVNEGKLSGTKGANYDLYSIYIKDKYSILNFGKNIKFKINYKQNKLEEAVKIAKKKKDFTLHHINGLRWEKIVDIVHLGEQPVFNLNAGKTNTYIVNGIQTHNTGGQMEKIKKPKHMFENPEAYEIFGIPNYWKRNKKKKIGLFIPYYYALSKYKDENGNTKLEEAWNTVVRIREDYRKKKGSVAYNSQVMYNPIEPDEMLRPSYGGYMPKQEAANRLNQIEAEDLFKKKAMIGLLEYDPREKYGIRFDLDLTNRLVPITRWNVDIEHMDPRGAFIMYEPPPLDIPEGLYYLLLDPVKESKDVNNETGMSFFSVLIYKNSFIGGSDEAMYDTIVAEWCGRHERLEDNFDFVVRIAKFYNAKIFPEMQDVGFVEYCSRKKLYGLLEGDSMHMEVTVSPGAKRNYYKVGTKMDGRKKNWCLQRVKDWLLDVHEYDINGFPAERVIDKLYSPLLLDEIINYNEDDNFDHVSSLLLLIFLLGKLNSLEVPLPEIKEYDPYEEYARLEEELRNSIAQPKKRCKFLMR